MGDSPRKGLYKFEPLSYNIIGACIDVQRQLGLHCMEVDYQRALAMPCPNLALSLNVKSKFRFITTGK